MKRNSKKTWKVFAAGMALVLGLAYPTTINAENEVDQSQQIQLVQTVSENETVSEEDISEKSFAVPGVIGAGMIVLGVLLWRRNRNV